jgi:zinc transporter ZupT
MIFPGMDTIALGYFLGLAVGLSMFLGCVLVFVAIQNQSKTVLSATQYFSSGILIAVVGQELLPDLKEGTKGARGTLAILAGFTFGVCLMYMVEHLIDDEKEDDTPVQSGTVEHDGSRQSTIQEVVESFDAHDPEAHHPAPAKKMHLSGLSNNRSFELDLNAPSLVRQSTPGGTGVASSRRARSYNVVTSITSLGPERAPERELRVKSSVPWALTLPIFVDAVMDGMLIGVMSVTNEHSAIVLALATAVEMMFLGITFGALVLKCGRKKWLLAALLPVVLSSSGAFGAVSANLLANELQEALTAFGIAALLFLACNELLKEAAENAAGESFRQSVWFFIGFLTIVMLERVLPDDIPIEEWTS